MDDYYNLNPSMLMFLFIKLGERERERKKKCWIERHKTSCVGIFLFNFFILTLVGYRFCVFCGWVGARWGVVGFGRWGWRWMGIRFCHSEKVRPRPALLCAVNVASLLDVCLLVLPNHIKKPSLNNPTQTNLVWVLGLCITKVPTHESKIGDRISRLATPIETKSGLP